MQGGRGGSRAGLVCAGRVQPVHGPPYVMGHLGPFTCDEANMYVTVPTAGGKN